MKIYKWLAKAVFWIHLTWIATVVVGSVLQIVFKWYVTTNLIIVGATVVSILLLPRCPLTKLENFLIAQYNPSQCYHRSFIRHYLNEYLSINCSSKIIIMVLCAVAAISATISIWLLIFIN